MDVGSQILYRINQEDEIIFVNNEWIRLAFDGEAPELVSENILRRGIREFISRDTIHHIYQMILRQARAGYSVKFKLRCRALEHQRYLKMTVSLQENGDVQFSARTIWMDECYPQNILYGRTSQMDEVIIICSWCNKIRIDEGDWQEIEELLKSLGMFDLELLPQPSHGMCDACYKIVSEKFQKNPKT